MIEEDSDEEDDDDDDEAPGENKLDNVINCCNTLFKILMCYC